tara:strand:- start:2462 stop:3139 length:678 start_codon:yes stop_codon:yes gene_type:complete
MEKTIKVNKPQYFLLDLIIYISIMFLIRETSIPNTHYLVTGFLYSGTTLLVASLQMKRRGITWKSIGLQKPKNLLKTLLKSGIVLICIFSTLIAYNLILDAFSIPEDGTSKENTAIHSAVKDVNYLNFMVVLFFVWVQSALEELLERAFLITWLEGLMANIRFRTAIAIVIQACIWGFRHSYDFSERSITVALIGIIMGIAYVKFGRNLWPVIIAHCVMNTISMF